MTAAVCGAAEILRSGGPVAVPFRPCCAAVLLRAGAPGREGADEGCPFGAGPAVEAQLLLLTGPLPVGDP
jgi:hypothetical protein